jgi:two-component system, cell cycle response regulator
MNRRNFLNKDSLGWLAHQRCRLHEAITIFRARIEILSRLSGENAVCSSYGYGQLETPQRLGQRPLREAIRGLAGTSHGVVQENAANDDDVESSMAILADVEIDGARYVLLRFPELGHSSPAAPLVFPNPQRQLEDGAPSERRHKFGNLRRVLVAESDSTTRLRLLHLLQEWGFEVASATHGAEVLPFFEQDQPPDLAIMNCVMPDIDGVELCRQICGQSVDHSPYILMMGQEHNRRDVVDCLESGAAEYLAAPFDQRELRARLVVAVRMLDLQDRLITSREEFRDQAARDALTGVWNRRRILALLDEELDVAERNDRPTGILMLDLDHFKSVNDTFGHLEGDLVLQEIALRLSTKLRSYDSLGRYGGEEFLIIAPGTSERELCELAERVRSAIESEPLLTARSDLRITLSIGAAMAKPGDCSKGSVIAVADEALYKAKKLGRNRIVFGL